MSVSQVKRGIAHSVHFLFGILDPMVPPMFQVLLLLCDLSERDLVEGLFLLKLVNAPDRPVQLPIQLGLLGGVTVVVLVGGEITPLVEVFEVLLKVEEQGHIQFTLELVVLLSLILSLHYLGCFSLSGQGVSGESALLFKLKLLVFAVVSGKSLYLFDVSLGHTPQVGMVWLVKVVRGGRMLKNS